MTDALRLCAVVPVYNHEHAVGAMVAGIRAQGLQCILVDDGSRPACAAVLDALAREPGVSLVRRPQNGGKGSAVIAGLRAAARAGFSHALQIDADGQHDPQDIQRFASAAFAHPDAVICGHPIYDASVPKGRLYGRYATHIWVWINTLSFDIRDSMCGYRIYPLAPTLALLERVRIGRRMDFDTEIIVRLYWRGLAVVNLPTRVRYPADGVSHFRMWADNARISWMHTRLFFGMLPRLPLLLARKFRRRTDATGAGT